GERHHHRPPRRCVGKWSEPPCKPGTTDRVLAWPTTRSSADQSGRRPDGVFRSVGARVGHHLSLRGAEGDLVTAGCAWYLAGVAPRGGESLTCGAFLFSRRMPIEHTIALSRSNLRRAVRARDLIHASYQSALTLDGMA